LYIAIGDEADDGRIVRIWVKPLVPLIWLGAIIMSIGGLFSLSDRRLRVGVPKSARKTKIAEKPVPASSPEASA